MALADFDEAKIHEYLKGSGILESFTDLNGNVKTISHMYYTQIDLTQVQDNQRAILIRSNEDDANAGLNTNLKDTNVILVFFGRNTQSDNFIMKDYYLQIKKFIAENRKGIGIEDIYCTGGDGPFRDADRPVYELRLRVRFC